MKRFLILLILPILACGGLAKSVSLPVTSSAPFTLITATLQPPSLPSPQAPSVQKTEISPQSTAKVSASIPTQPQAVPGRAVPDPNNYGWKQVASGFNRPVDVRSANDGTGRLFVVEKYGAIRIIENGQLLNTPFLNIDSRVDDSGNEMGLLGLVFSPNYAQNGFFYVNYTGDGGNTRISRYHAMGNLADPDSEVILLKIDQPFPNHNGGSLAFGPDGYLYAGMGDGGLAGDPYKNGQNKNSLLGKILRIDVNSGNPYSIPADNPFSNEVWAYGLRNPWRISFDRTTGDLWIGDVGQDDWEEIDYLPTGSAGGSNFGWSIMEGNHNYDGAAQPGLLLPVTEYSHREGGCSVTGGYVYRGAMPEWQGIYFYGDYCTGYIWGLFPSNGAWQSKLMFETGAHITSFGQDASGELYLASDNGSIYKFAKK